MLFQHYIRIRSDKESEQIIDFIDVNVVSTKKSNDVRENLRKIMNSSKLLFYYNFIIIY